MNWKRTSTQPQPRRRRTAPAPPSVAEPAASQSTYQPRRRAADNTTAAKTRSFWLQRIGIIVLLVVAVASVINVLSLSQNAKVLPVASGQTLPVSSQEAYKAAADKLLADSIWSGNKLTVNTSEISKELLKQFPELTDASVTIPLLARRPVVYVETAKPSLILLTTSGAYLLDNSGKALGSSPNASDFNQPDLPVVTDQSNLRFKPNDQAVPAATIAFVRTVKAQLAAKDFSVTEISLPANGSQLDVRLEGQPYSVKFNLQGKDARQQAGTFIATIKYLKQQNMVPAQYVDVRVDGRAYYQ